MPYVEYPGFCGPTGKDRQEAQDVSRSINLYPHRTAGGRLGMRARPGHVLFGNPGGGQGRALYGGDERMFAVVGSTLYEISNVGGATGLGSIGSGTSPCTILNTGGAGNQLMVINPDTGQPRIHDGVSMTDAPYTASMGAFLDGYGFVVTPNTNIVKQTSLRDFKTLTGGGTAFAERLGAEDRVAQLISDHQNLYLAGRKTTETWYNAGGANFVLARVQNAFIEEGASSSFGIATGPGCLVMLTGSNRGAGRVVAIRPGRADRLSTYAVEQAIQGYNTNLGEAIAWTYQSLGHWFYVISFPSQGAQWVYDFTENAWHERNTAGIAGAYGACPGDFHCCTFNNQHFVLDKETGKIYRMDETITADEGAQFRRQRIGPALYSAQRARIHRLRVGVQVGGGTGTEAIGLKASRDGGISWDAAYDASAVQQGTNNDGVAEWRTLGQADQRGFAADVAIDDAGITTIAGAWIDATLDAA